MERQMPTGIVEAAHPLGKRLSRVLNRRAILKIGPTRRLIHALLMENLRAQFCHSDMGCPDCAKADPAGVSGRFGGLHHADGTGLVRDGDRWRASCETVSPRMEEKAGRRGAPSQCWHGMWGIPARRIVGAGSPLSGSNAPLQMRGSTSEARGIEGWAPRLRQASEPATAARRSASGKASFSSRLAAR